MESTDGILSTTRMCCLLTTTTITTTTIIARETAALRLHSLDSTLRLSACKVDQFMLMHLRLGTRSIWI